MSQSPTRAQDDADEYVNGWLALSQILSAGGSLSGQERNCCFLNTGGPRFADISAISGLDFDDDGRAIGIVDWDQDGRLDLWIANRTAPRIRWMRNVIDSGHHFISLRLEGVTCNRDAIGARVAVDLASTPPQTITRTLRAGDGFLSQASKRVHLGLGTEADIERVRVRWPGGDWETFNAIQPDRQYRLVQGQGADGAILERRTPHAVPSTAKSHVAEDSNAGRVVLAGRLPMPSFEFRNGQGERVRLDSNSGPLLLKLWASDCRPCLMELRELSHAAADLRHRGLQLLALSVDGEDDLQRAAKILEQINWPDDLSSIDERGLQLLDIVQRIVTSRRVPMPVPTSFLIDQRGHLAVLYRGPVSVDQLQTDLQLLDTEAEMVLQSALPFPGRWLQPPTVAESTLVELMFEYLNAGFHDVARTYVQHLESREQSSALRDSLATAYLHLGTELARQAETESAMRDFRQSLAADPQQAKAHYGLAILLKSSGQGEQAVKHFRGAIAAEPAYAEAHYQLGLAMVSLGSAPAAIQHCEHALRLRPDWIEPLNILARIHAAHPDPAIRNPQRAVELATRAARLTGRRDRATLQTLAAAQAAAGQPELAAATLQAALDLAVTANDQQTAAKLRQQLQKYRHQGGPDGPTGDP